MMLSNRNHDVFKWICSSTGACTTKRKKKQVIQLCSTWIILVNCDLCLINIGRSWMNCLLHFRKHLAVDEGYGKWLLLRCIGVVSRMALPILIGASGNESVHHTCTSAAKVLSGRKMRKGLFPHERWCVCNRVIVITHHFTSLQCKSHNPNWRRSRSILPTIHTIPPSFQTTMTIWKSTRSLHSRLRNISSTKGCQEKMADALENEARG